MSSFWTLVETLLVFVPLRWSPCRPAVHGARKNWNSSPWSCALHRDWGHMTMVSGLELRRLTRRVLVELNFQSADWNGGMRELESM